MSTTWALVLAVVAGIFFAGSAVAARKAAYGLGESYTTTAAGIFLGVPFFAIVISLAGDWPKLMAASTGVILRLAAAGVIHFIIGRVLAYEAYRLIGANKATPFQMTNLIEAVVLSAVFLHEPITGYTIAGSAGIFAGTSLISTEQRSVALPSGGGRLSTNAKGILLVLAGALCWGITPEIIKPAVAEIGSPFVGVFVSYLAAAVVFAIFYITKHARQQMARARARDILFSVVAGGTFAAAGQLLHYTALGNGPASLVVPLVNTTVLFTFLFSFFINRRIEVFTARIVTGMVVALVGTFILFL
jgi:drug/metabolite transporter (DMT)-like permease